MIPIVHDLMTRFLDQRRVSRRHGDERRRRAAAGAGVAPHRDHAGCDDAAHGWLGGACGAKVDPETEHIPVIMLTMMDDRNMGYALGATDYLTKPIDRERLAGILRKYRHG